MTCMNLGPAASRYSRPAAPNQHGVSLIELMVALVISALLGIGLVQIFGATRMSFNTNSALARAQENSRFALEFMQRDLRMAAHLGTRNEQGSRPGVTADLMENNFYNHFASSGSGKPDSAPWLYQLNVPIYGLEYSGTGMNESYDLGPPEVATSGWSPALPSDLSVLSGKALKGSDIFILRYLSPEYVTLINTAPRPDGITAHSALDPFVLDAGGDAAEFLWDSGLPGLQDFVEAGGVYAFSNARSISLFQVTSVELTGTTDVKKAVVSGGLNTRGWSDGTRPLSMANTNEDTSSYGFMMPVHRYQVAVYYVGIGADEENPALFRRRLSSDGKELAAAEELVSGVESMQVVYGVVNVASRQSDQPLAYMTAADINDGLWATPESRRWADVVSVRVGLVMRSDQPGAGVEAAPVAVLNTEMVPPDGDRRFRQVYELQSSLRNRSRG